MTAGYPGVHGVLQHGYWGLLGGTGTGVRKFCGVRGVLRVLRVLLGNGKYCRLLWVMQKSGLRFLVLQSTAG